MKRLFLSFPLETCPSAQLKEKSVSLVPLSSMPHSSPQWKVSSTRSLHWSMTLCSPQRNVSFPRSPQKHAPQFSSKESQFHSFPSLKHAPQFTSKECQFPSFPSEACTLVHFKETSVSLIPLRSMHLSSPQRKVRFTRYRQKHAPQFTSKKSQFHSFPSLKHAPQFTSKKCQIPSFPSEACHSVQLKG